MNPSPLPIQKFFDNNGRPLTGGLLFTYTAGTSTKVATASDQAGTPNTNPVVLNYRGEANVWLDPTLTYKFVLSPEGDTDPPTRPIWTVDNISAGITFASLTASIIGLILWPRNATEIAAGVTPTLYNYPYNDTRRSSFYTNSGWLDYFDVGTFISTTSFSIPGDVTARYPVQRYLQIRSNAGGAVVGRITGAVFAAGITTFTMSMETGNVPNPVAGVFLAMGMMTDYPLGLSFSLNGIPTGPIFWNTSNGTGAVSRILVASGTSGTGSDVALAIVAIQNSYGSFPYITGAPSGRQIVIHTGVSAPITFGVFDVAKLSLVTGNGPSRFYTDVEVNNNQSGATLSNLIVDFAGVSRLTMRTSGTDVGFVAGTASNELLIGSNSANDISIVYNGGRVITFNGATTTGAATPTFGANKPGANSAVAEWMPVKNSAGTQRYIPLWS